jgi:hypothetical protein
MGVVMRVIIALAVLIGTVGFAQARETSLTEQQTFSVDAGGIEIQPTFRLATRAETAQNLQLDPSGTLYSGSAILPLVRAGAKAKWKSGSWLLSGRYEHDLYADTLSLGDEILGEAPPLVGQREFELRRLGLRVSNVNLGSLYLGFDTPHWGLGMLTNDGDHGWTPGSARFADLRGGDRYALASFGTMVNKELKWVVSASGSLIMDDDILLENDELSDTRFGADDRARQAAIVSRIGDKEGTHAGVYYAYRWQDAADGRSLRVHAMDATGTAKFAALGGEFTVSGEGVLLIGETDIAGSAAFPTQDVRQAAAGLRSTADFGRVGGAFDAAFASGDRNLDDRYQSGFRFDPNYDMGLLMYRAAIAGQTSLGASRAADPELSGVPSPGLERFPSRGSITNTVAFFPRAWVRPLDSLEIYGGPLVAWTVTPLVDPLNTRENGGVARNALGGDPGSFLGTELDVGVRYTLELATTQLQLGAEGGALFPGSAMRRPGNEEVVYGGRAIIDWRM